MSKTIKDFKKRTNKTNPHVYNYEMKSADGYYKFSIYKLFSPAIYFNVERRQAGEWKTEIKEMKIENIEEGVRLTNNFLAKQGNE